MRSSFSRPSSWFPALFLVVVAAGVLPGRASAHSLLLRCAPAAGDMVRCVAEFSDGSDAAGMPVQVMAYDERVLEKGTLGGDSSWQFKRPSGEFFVRLDDGGEHSAEVDHADIQP